MCLSLKRLCLFAWCIVNAIWTSKEQNILVVGQNHTKPTSGTFFGDVTPSCSSLFTKFVGCSLEYRGDMTHSRFSYVKHCRPWDFLRTCRGGMSISTSWWNKVICWEGNDIENTECHIKTSQNILTHTTAKKNAWQMNFAFLEKKHISTAKRHYYPGHLPGSALGKHPME